MKQIKKKKETNKYLDTFIKFMQIFYILNHDSIKRKKKYNYPKINHYS